ncbi:MULTISPECIES: hypothetical protein [Enterococcus]|uniref:Uncharacterized protein n=1 Tax=Candidatus Enterococcus mangumiae TaxID=2230878 RepID=A0ABZ2SVH1_9ENTE|nr:MULTISPECIES: hypothetical protein [unclassified Enterococcus]MBO0462306.1 hypothetical protein [Enterococcus sp. DIV1298c]MBO0490910.1 hypothetical protein [Enterococcus sp. DIV1094]MBO1298915.1 hypothetical protein [Enterococcus sp. DIV1271a]
MLKNFLETESGKKIIIGLGLLVVVIAGLVGYSLINTQSSTKEATDTSAAVQETRDSRDRFNATIYSGTWYTNLPDDTEIELATDGTYKVSSDWFESGIYYLNTRGEVVLESDNNRTKEFALQTRMGNTILHRKEDGEDLYLYPTEEVKAQLEAEMSEQIEAAQRAVSQMWLDILMQGTWENTNNSRSFTLEFTEDTFTQKKVEEGRADEEATFKYRIMSFDTDHEGANFVVMRTDSRDTQKTITFRITEEANQYRLMGNEGSFQWIAHFEKPYETVQMTQDGTSRSDTSRTQETTDEDGNTVIITERDVN